MIAALLLILGAVGEAAEQAAATEEPAPIQGAVSSRQRVGSSTRRRPGEGLELSLSLDLGIEPRGESAEASGILGLEVETERGLSMGASLPLEISLGIGRPRAAIGGSRLSLGWTARRGDLGFESSLDLRLPASATGGEGSVPALAVRAGLGTALDPVAMGAWGELSFPLRPPASPWESDHELGFGFSLAHALNDVLSIGAAAELRVSGAPADPRVSRSYLGGAGISFAASLPPWSLSVASSFGLPEGGGRLSLGARRVFGGAQERARR